MIPIIGSSGINCKHLNGCSSSGCNLLPGIDPFDAVFDAFQSLLYTSRSADSEVNDSRRAHNMEDALCALSERGIRDATTSRLEYIKKTRMLTVRSLSSKIRTETLKVQTMESIYFQTEAACLRHKEISKRRLIQQAQGAERRMRELVFEIIGEYGKSEVRLCRRQEYLLQTTQLKLTGRVSRLRWERFVHRICKDPSPISPASKMMEGERGLLKGDTLSGKVLCHLGDSREISAVTSALKKIQRELLPHVLSKLHIVTVVRFSRPVHSPKRVRQNSTAHNSSISSAAATLTRQTDTSFNSPNQHGKQSKFLSDEVQLVTNTAQFLAAMEQLNSWILGDKSKKANQSKDDNLPIESIIQPGVKSIEDKIHASTDFLSVSHCVWLHPSSFYPVIWQRIARSVSGVLKCAGPQSDKLEDQDEAQYMDCRNSSKGNNFMSRYCLQHTSHLSIDRVYLCLEERRLTSDQSQAKGGETTAQLYDYLQRCYVSSAITKKTDPRFSDAHALRRYLTTEPFYVQRYLSRHSKESAVQDPLDVLQKGPIDSELRSRLRMFPDIVQVRSVSDETLHFAPACSVQIFETAAAHTHTSPSSFSSRSHARSDVSQCSDNGDIGANLTHYEMSSCLPVSNKIPHSVPGSFSSSNGASHPDVDDVNQGKKEGSPSVPALLDRLFCMVQVTPVSSLCSALSRIALSSSPGNATQDPSLQSFQVMIPLSDPCMAELLQGVHLQHECVVEEDVYPKGSEALHLLPDHACSRSHSLKHNSKGSILSATTAAEKVAYTGLEDFDNTQRNGDKIGRNGDSCQQDGDNSPTDFHHQYLVLPGSRLHAYSECSINDNSPPNTLNDGGDSYYLIQLHGGGRDRIENDNNPHQPQLQPRGVMQHSSVLHDDELLRSLLSTCDVHITAAGVRNRVPSDSAVNIPTTCVRGTLDLDTLEDSNNSQQPHMLSNFTPILTYDEKCKDAIHDVERGREKEKERARGGNVGEVESLHSPRRWDASVLSTLCRWRSCLLEGYRKSPHLCQYHSDLKVFLDNRSTSSAISDATKFLPRRVPNLSGAGSSLETVFGPAVDSRKDLTMIRAASTLLQELWDGKLKATLRSFVKKTAHDMRMRKRLMAAAKSHQLLVRSPILKPSGNTSPTKAVGTKKKATSHSDGPSCSHNTPVTNPHKGKHDVPSLSLSSIHMPLVPKPPVWAVWKDRSTLERTTQQLEESLRLQYYILEIERQISSELKVLTEMKVFPLQEILLIKKDMKAYKEKVIISKLKQQERSDDGEKRGRENGAAFYESDIDDEDENRELCKIERIVAERKLFLLRERRQAEQESRMIQARKLAKARAALELQSKDPSNFINYKKNYF